MHMNIISMWFNTLYMSNMDLVIKFEVSDSLNNDKMTSF
jgi:hypothetical protein